MIMMDIMTKAVATTNIKTVLVAQVRRGATKVTRVISMTSGTKMAIDLNLRAQDRGIVHDQEIVQIIKKTTHPLVHGKIQGQGY